jgi:hypothetical protein
MKRQLLALVGVFAVSAWVSACSLLEKDDEGDDGKTKSGTGGASLGGQGGEGGVPITSSGICGLRPDELALKTESEEVKGHTHLVDIPIINLEQMKQGTFTLQLSPGVDHVHTIHLTERDFQTLVTSGEFTVTSNRNKKHTHDVHLVCPLPQ